jgi:AsmA protein
VLGVLIVALVALAVTISLVVDPNDYKDEIIAAVKDHTGRELRIEGDLKLSLFPWLGLEKGGIELANAPGFGEQPFARVAAAGVRVKVLPLLQRELVVDTVTLNGLVLNLMRNRAGATNWQDLRTTAPEQPKAKPAPSPVPAAIGALTIGGIEIRAGEIDWRDEVSGAHYALHDLTLSGGKVVPGEPVDLSLAFDLETRDPPARARIELETRATLDLGEQTLDVARVALRIDELGLKANFKASRIMEAPLAQGTLEIALFDPRPLMKKLAPGIKAPRGEVLRQVELESQFALDLDHQTLALSGLRLRVDEVALNADITASNILGKPALAGRVDIAPFNPRPFIRVLAPDFKPAAKNALTRTSLKSDFRADLGRQTLALSKLALRVDDIALNADIKASNILAKPRLSGELALPGFRPAAIIALLGLEVAPNYWDAVSRASVKTRFSAAWVATRSMSQICR